MPTKPKNGRQNYNWNLIMTDYISDAGTSLKDISEKYGIRLRTVKDKSKADDWFATKQEYQKKLRLKAAQKVAPEKVNALAQELRSVQKASDVIVTMFSDDKQFNRHLVTNTTAEAIETTEEIFDKVDTRALKDALSCLKLIEEMKRSMLEEQKVGERQRHEIERERLALEKERIALERERMALKSQYMGADEDTNYGVVLIPEVIGNE